MSEPQYRVLFGLSLLISIYFDWPAVVCILVTLLLFESISNSFIPERLSRWHANQASQQVRCSESPNHEYRFNLEADRVTRFIIAILITLSYFILPELLWILTWFIGFNIVLAGICNCCPTTLLFQKLGFR